MSLGSPLKRQRVCKSTSKISVSAYVAGTARAKGSMVRRRCRRGSRSAPSEETLKRSRSTKDWTSLLDAWQEDRDATCSSHEVSVWSKLMTDTISSQAPAGDTMLKKRKRSGTKMNSSKHPSKAFRIEEDATFSLFDWTTTRRIVLGPHACLTPNPCHSPLESSGVSLQAVNRRERKTLPALAQSRYQI